MITPIKNMLKMWQGYGIDMFNCISLSSNANALKHKMMYKDLDPNTDYNTRTYDTAFVPTQEWAEKKEKTYIEQDKKAGRSTDENI
jgi:hypothetical protein